MLQQVTFCGLPVTRLILGANPFGGFSHQNTERDQDMLAYYTPERIKETWDRAEAAGITAFVTNNSTPHITQAVGEYFPEQTSMYWIAQVKEKSDMFADIDEVVSIGCSAIYFHGAQVEELYRTNDDTKLRSWCDYVHSHGLPVGVAGHAPEAHYWVNDLDIVDFHAVCFFNCGSLHENKGDKFRLKDVQAATACIQSIQRPCIAYKVMGAGRIDAAMALEYAFENIKSTDVVNVGVYRKENDSMVEENVAIARDILQK